METKKKKNRIRMCKKESRINKRETDGRLQSADNLDLCSLILHIQQKYSQVSRVND